MAEAMITEEILKNQFNRRFKQKTFQKKAKISCMIINPSKKKTKKNITTRIKSRNYLLNIAYADVNDNDIIDKNFFFDMYVLITKNINPFSLERKIADQTKYELIYMLWKECMLGKFYKFICRKKFFTYLISKNVLHPKVSNIVRNFIAEDETNYKKLRENLRKNINVFQYVYSIVYPDIYCSSEERGYDLRSEYLINFKEYRDRKKVESLGKKRKNI